MPSPEEALQLWTERHVREIKASSAGSVYEGFLGLAGALKQRSDADDLIAFLLKFFFGHLRMEKVQAAAAQAGTGSGERPPEPRRRERARGERSERPERGPRPGQRRERPPRRDRPDDGPAPGTESSSAEQTPGQVRLWLNLGSSDSLDAAGVAAALEELGAPAGKLKRVDLRPTYAYAFVAEEDAPAFEALSGKTHGTKTLKVERARRR
jgi:ATP-dependent RNA helicase DeaD